MNLNTNKLKVAAIALALSVSVSAFAETSREEVVHAYHLLEKADHDYAGHRVAAMEELKSAGHELGLHLEGDLPVRERQWKSDASLMEARRLLKDARDKMEEADRRHLAAHLEKAIKELDRALDMK